MEGSQYRFSCKGGYSLVGANTLQCTDQGNWNGSVPTCLKGTGAREFDYFKLHNVALSLHHNLSTEWRPARVCVLLHFHSFLCPTSDA